MIELRFLRRLALWLAERDAALQRRLELQAILGDDYADRAHALAVTAAKLSLTVGDLEGMAGGLPRIGSIRVVTGPGRSIPSAVTSGAIRLYPVLGIPDDLPVGTTLVEFIYGRHADSLLESLPAMPIELSDGGDT